eukprot:TRINITY_DN55114_c0_g1_i1.p1 TRINITY_DN55114_c0_g1~~TRINITY_DN55114_c0_g1_i1.p1  ORF type:complete len:356 (+),score=59.82 TRINITY_DN55114_c0_g1_i1:114-1181(+)
MGRGSGPQGGAGNQGGALSSKSAKPRKPRATTSSSKKKKKTIAESHSESEDEAPPSYTVVRPDPQQRAELLNAGRREERMLEARRAALARRPIDGTEPVGAIIGGEVAIDAEDMRNARLQRLAKQNAKPVALPKQSVSLEAAKPQSDTPHDSNAGASSQMPELERLAAAQAVASLPPLSGVFDASADVERVAKLRPRVDVLLELLVDRLGQNSLERSMKVLRTILENARTKDDPKYHCLKARNDKLWLTVLQHPELCALLEVAGFRRQHVAEDEREKQHQVELEIVQAQLHDQLEAAETPNQAAVESLLCRLEALRLSPVPLAPQDNVRNFTFMYRGGESLRELVIVLEATSAWI